MPKGLSTPPNHEFVLEWEGQLPRAMSASVLDRQSESKTGRKNSPLYRVILHDDPVNTIEFVVKAVHRVMGYSKERSIEITMEVHTTGSSVVTVCDLEPAEHYCESFKSLGLTSTIEKDE